MATINSSNTYIVDNKLNDGIFTYDLVAFKKVYGELKQYGIVLFKKNNLYVVHRIIDDPSSDSFHTQGDANPIPDEWVVNSNEAMDVYTHKIPFLSFLNYLSYNPWVLYRQGAFTIGMGIAIYLCDRHCHVPAVKVRRWANPHENPAYTAKSNLTRATVAGKEGGGETETLRTGTCYQASWAGKMAKGTTSHWGNRTYGGVRG